MNVGCVRSATLVGQRIIIIGGLGTRVWSCKEVSGRDPMPHSQTYLLGSF